MSEKPTCKAVIDLIERRLVEELESLSKSGAASPATLFGVSVIATRVLGEARDLANKEPSQ